MEIEELESRLVVDAIFLPLSIYARFLSEISQSSLILASCSSVSLTLALKL